MIESRSTIAAEVQRFDYNSNPAARRASTPPKPTDASESFGLEGPSESESAVAKSLLALFASPPAPRAERSLSGLAIEVRQEFAEAQRMPRARR